MRKKKVFCIGDLHFPYVKKRILSAIYEAIEREQPDVVIQMGDLFDMFAWTRFPRSHRLMTPCREVKDGRKMAAKMWKEIQKRVPKAECIQLKGNHDDRPYKRLMDKAPELEPFFAIKDYFCFPGVRTIHDTRYELIIDDILYTHGHLSKLGDHMRYYLRCVVRAHDHTGGIAMMNLNTQVIWEMSVGFVADKSMLPLRYSPTRTVRWTWGYGIVDEHGPRFFPLQ